MNMVDPGSREFAKRAGANSDTNLDKSAVAPASAWGDPDAEREYRERFPTAGKRTCSAKAPADPFEPTDEDDRVSEKEASLHRLGWVDADGSQ